MNEDAFNVTLEHNPLVETIEMAAALERPLQVSYEDKGPTIKKVKCYSPRVKTCRLEDGVITLEFSEAGEASAQIMVHGEYFPGDVVDLPRKLVFHVVPRGDYQQYFRDQLRKIEEEE